VSVVIASNANEARDFDARLREIHAPVARLTALIAGIVLGIRAFIRFASLGIVPALRRTTGDLAQRSDRLAKDGSHVAIPGRRFSISR